MTNPAHLLVLAIALVGCTTDAELENGEDLSIASGAPALLPSDDTFVQGGSAAGKTFGAEPQLRVKQSSSVDFVRQAFLRFDLSSIAGRQVVSARLVIHVASVGNDVDTAGVRQRLSTIESTSWREASLTYTTRPTLGAAITTFTVAGPRSIDVDVAALVTAAVQANRTAIGFAITGVDNVAGARDIYYGAKELADASKRPGLYLELAERAPDPSPGGSLLVSAAELAQIKSSADKGVAPHASNRTALVADANRAWSWGTVSGTFVTTADSSGTKACHPSGSSSTTYYLTEGASHAYAKILAYHLTGTLAFATDARARLLDLVDTSGFTGLSGDNYSAANQCILELGESIPNWIVVAQLLEGTSAWSSSDAAAFKSWLAKQVYAKVAWASRVRNNNWGTAGSLAASSIARYVDGTIAGLAEVSPNALTLTPGQAAAAHDQMQLQRMSTTWKGDSQCAVHGIQSNGGIPDELRRGSTGCTGDHLLAMDASHSYQTMHVELLVYHAEALRRRGDTRLVQAALLRAILFVIANPRGSWDWGTRKGTLYVADQLFHDPATRSAAPGGSFRGGRILPYARLTHYLR